MKGIICLHYCLCKWEVLICKQIQTRYLSVSCSVFRILLVIYQGPLLCVDMSFTLNNSLLDMLNIWWHVVLMDKCRMLILHHSFSNPCKRPKDVPFSANKLKWIVTLHCVYFYFNIYQQKKIVAKDYAFCIS